MKKLAHTNKYVIYKSSKRFMGLLVKCDAGDFLKYIRDFVCYVEDIYVEIRQRINWLLSDTVEAHTADDTLTEEEERSVHTNLGASGTVTLTLPTVSKAGIRFTFAVQAAQELRVDPAAKTIRDDSGQTANKYKSANAIGESLQLISDANGDWLTISKNGSWTEET